MRCLHCGKRLSVIRKLAGSGYCSEAHRRAYLEEQETLGLARLIEAKQQPERKAKPQKATSRAKTGSREAPAFFDKFLPQPLRARSVVVPYQQPGPPITPEMTLVAPQQEVQLGFCRLPRAAIEAPRSIAKSGIDFTPPVPAENTSTKVTISLPVSAAKPSQEQGPDIPGRAGAVRIVLAVPVSESKPAITTAVAVPPERMVAAPLLSIRLRQTVPSGRFVEPAVVSPELKWQSPQPVATSSLAPTALLPRWTAGPPADADLQELLAAYERESRGGFLSLLRAVAPAEGLRDIASSWMRSGSISCRLPRRTVQWPVRLQSTGDVPAEFQQASPNVPVIEPSVLVCEVSARMPAPVSLDLPLTLGSQGRVSIPTAFCVGSREPFSDEPLAAPWRPFMLPPPDVVPVAPRPALSRELAHYPMAGMFAAEHVRTSGIVAAPLKTRANGPHLPRAIGVPAPTGLAASSEPVRGGQEQKTVAAEPLHSVSPVSVQVEMPRLPTADGGNPPVALHKASRAASNAHTETHRDTGPATSPSYEEHGTEEARRRVVIPGATSQRSDVKASALGTAEQNRPGLVPIGLGALVPTNAANHHLTSFTTRGMAPDAMIPPSGLHTVAELSGEIGRDAAQGPPLWKRAWGPVAARSQSVRKGLVWTTLAAGVFLAFHFYTPPQTPVVTEAEVETQDEPRTELAGHWASFQADIANRAAINLEDDFRSGLGNWTGEDGWSETWAYDDTGYIRPGNLALYRPTIPLDDYQVSFSGQIEEGGLSWAVRAADTQNYYLIRLVVAETWPEPRVNIVRYPVVEGRRGEVTTTPLPFPIRNGQTHEIGTALNGEDFTLYVNGRLVDFWSEPRLASGGVGFLHTPGEASRVRRVSVTHQQDLIGRLCALLVPYNFENASRSIER